MIRILLPIIFVLILIMPVSAMEFTAPEVPDSGEIYMPSNTESFTDGLLYILKKAIEDMQPDIAAASKICLSLIVVVLLTSILNSFSGQSKRVVNIVAALTIGTMLMGPSNTLIQLGTQTITELSEYGKLLLPVITAAVAAQGGITASTALYTGTVLFSSILTAVITKFILPMVYIYVALCIANSAIEEDLLKNLRDFGKWMMTWSLKIVLYVFTGYISITGVIHGTVDAAAIKATKLAISGVVPVVGNIISDASETILVSAGVMKNAVGVYGVLAIIAIWIGPFVKVGIQYLLLKITAAICRVFGNKQASGLIQDFSNTMGIILAAVGAVCLLLLISMVCFMKGVG